LKEKEWIEGYKNIDGEKTGLYHPESNVTKAEISKLAFQIANIDFENINEMSKNPFAQTHWASKIINLAEESNLSMWKDFPNPDKKTTRGEVIRLIFEVFKLEPPKKFWKNSFSDINISSDNFRYIEHAKRIGLISGYPDGTFRENDPILRAEAAKIIQNAHEILQ